AKDYLVGPAVREHVAPEASADEALLLSEAGDELHVGLFLGEPVLAQLSHGAEAPWSHERLRGFCAAAEGVSHFRYLLHRPRAGGALRREGTAGRPAARSAAAIPPRRGRETLRLRARPGGLGRVTEGGSGAHGVGETCVEVFPGTPLRTPAFPGSCCMTTST